MRLLRSTLAALLLLLAAPAVAAAGTINVTDVAFGIVNEGSSLSLDITVSNSADSPTNYSGVTLTANPNGFYSQSGTTCGATIPASGNCTIAIRFAPAVGSRGTFIGSATVNSNDAAAGSDMVSSLSGTTGYADIHVPTMAYSFGSQPVGAGPTTGSMVTIANQGNVALTFTIGNPTSGMFARTVGSCGGGTPLTVPANSSCTFDVSFDPSTRGTFNGTITVSTVNDPDEQFVQLAMSGTGVAPVAGSVTNLSFGNQPIEDGATTRSLVVTNQGDAGQDLNISNVTADSAEYTIAGCALPANLAAGQSCTFQVSFDPSATGARNATVSITSNDPVTPTRVVTVTGTGTDREIVVSPSSMSFGERSVDAGPTASQALTIQNSGTAPLSYSASVFSTHFQLATGTCPGLSGTIGPSSSCTLLVTFDPASAGALADNVTITSNDTDEQTTTVALSGTGLQQEIAVSPSSLTFAVTGVDAGPAASQSVTISNSGTAPLTYSVATSTQEFRVAGDTCQTPDGTIAAGSSCVLLVVFDPTEIGVRSGTLTITSNDADEPTTSVALSGSAQAGGGPVADQGSSTINTTAISFGTRAITAGPTAARAVTVTNTGNIALSMGALGQQGSATGPFRITVAACASAPTLPVSTACSVQVRFDPTVVGAASDTMTWTVGATGHSVTLRGTGCSYRLAAGCPGNDTITGTFRADTLFGGLGADVMRGMAAADNLTGGAGNDTIVGGAGRDTLVGGLGADRILGGLDPDTIRGDAGNDTIDVRGGGADVVDCGLGRLDLVLRDRSDRVSGCERVRIS